MTTDRMRAEFEAWAKAEGFDLARWVRIEADGRCIPTEYADADTRAAEKGYAAGRKAERETIRKLISPQVVAPLIKLSERVNKAIQRNNPEGER